GAAGRCGDEGVQLTKYGEGRAGARRPPARPAASWCAVSIQPVQVPALVRDLAEHPQAPAAAGEGLAVVPKDTPAVPPAGADPLLAAAQSQGAVEARAALVGGQRPGVGQQP